MGHRGMGLRILVVDDNADTARSLAALLEMEDFEVEVALNADAALEAVEDFQPDVAIIDIGMPRVDGYSLCRSLRARVSGCRMVAYSGQPPSKEDQAALFDMHVRKPTVPVEAILALLARARK
jgi:DNA-binding response OmpR family regulator